jgi:phosphocarrier protein
MSGRTQVEFDVVIENSLGVHARPASMLVQLASQFDSIISIQKDDQTVDCKSLMGVLMLAAGKGSELKFIIQGEDAEEAKEAFIDLIVNRKFDEE